ncbi:MAG TPA: glyoxalase [Desulfobacteraceae bacterium]|nr:glyoxalase [Desulfobacteraceae bacterium]|tara:strand:- start:3755 stop:4201 length:447 start_codon:yes stop_codon:yes gene_type:complete
MKYVHTNIAARDWKTLADFYCSVFDCRIKPPERDYSGDWLDRATGLTGARLKGAHLILPGYGDDGPTLEIFTYDKMVDTESIMANHQGFTHIAFEVTDVRKTYEKALAHGGQPMGKVTEKKVPGIGTLVFIYFKDPEGNIIEIQSWEK